jgi:hypothetical protein
MKTGTLIYQSKTSILQYFIPSLLLFATISCFIICYFNELNYIIAPGILAFATLIYSFKDFLTIKIYDDKFEIIYNNVFGNFFRITNTYFFGIVKGLVN